jgi:hypothetical protein
VAYSILRKEVPFDLHLIWLKRKHSAAHLPGASCPEALTTPALLEGWFGDSKIGY